MTSQVSTLVAARPGIKIRAFRILSLYLHAPKRLIPFTHAAHYHSIDIALHMMRFQDDVLSHVLSYTYIEPKMYRFIAGVSRQWKQQHRLTYGPETITSLAAATSSLSTILVYAREVRAPITTYRAALHYKKIGENGDLAMVQWLYARNILSLSTSLMAGAAYGGHLDLMKWLRANGCPWDFYICACAAQEGHLNVLKWARANGCDWDGTTCSYAAASGHLDILKWAKANGCNWDEDTCSYAAQEGQLGILKWARANDCPWDRRTCSRAAERGHLEVIQWARVNGCDWSELTYSSAAHEGQLDVLKWAIANGCQWSRELCLDVARDQGHRTTEQWILSVKQNDTV